MLASQPVFETAYKTEIEYLALALLVMGTIFVVTSVWQLGYTGTFHGKITPCISTYPGYQPAAVQHSIFLFPGDHFGLLLPEKVTGFPFNVLDHPMYEGGMINFLGAALGWVSKSWSGSQSLSHHQDYDNTVDISSRRMSIAGILLTVWVQLVYNVTEAFEG